MPQPQWIAEIDSCTLMKENGPGDIPKKRSQWSLKNRGKKPYKKREERKKKQKNGYPLNPHILTIVTKLFTYPQT